jgi:hypothetical protein
MERNEYSFLDVYTQEQNRNEPSTTPRPDITIIKETFPRLDKVLNPVGRAVWDAWLIGLEQSGYNVHRQPEPEKDSMEPEI